MNPGTSVCAAPTKVLVVDDSQTTRALLRKTLSLYGYEVVEACDGAAAWLLLQQQPDFAVLVIDLSMPLLDGISLIRRIRSDRNLPRFPILVLTAGDHAKEEPPPAGADALMLKPFKPSELVAQIRALTAQSKAPLAPCGSHAPGGD
jgi:CheY-like chemotaxis protein